MKTAIGPTLCLILVGCAGSPLSLAPSATVDGVVVRNDAVLERKLARSLRRLASSGESPSIQDLSGQLGRKSTEVEPVAPADRELSAAAVFRAAEPSVVTLSRRYLCGWCDKWHTAHASGFAIADGIIVTNHHVIEGDQEGIRAVGTGDGKVFPIAEVLAANETDDLAVVRLGGKGPFPPPLPLGRPALVGAPVYSISHPDGRFFHCTSGIVSRYVARGPGRARMDVTAPYAQGSSGGPILDRFGNVVGVISSTMSLYTDGDEPKLQMVIGSTAPVAAIRRLIGASPMDPR